LINSGIVTKPKHTQAKVNQEKITYINIVASSILVVSLIATKTAVQALSFLALNPPSLLLKERKKSLTKLTM